MKHRIKWVAPVRTALTAALILLLLSFPLILAVATLSLFQPPSPPSVDPTPFLPPVVVVTVPIFAAVMAFIFTGLGALFYNLFAGLGLGVVIRIEPNPPEPNSARDGTDVGVPQR